MFTKGWLAATFGRYAGAICALLWGALVLGVAHPVAAQTVSNPTTVEFIASLDHNTEFGGVPILTRYDLRIYLQGATSPFVTYDVGKPTPDANNKIVVVNAAWFVGLAYNSLYYARVASVGPAGEAASDPSNPFGNAAIPRAPAVPPVVR
jgi:hypothetical protein